MSETTQRAQILAALSARGWNLDEIPLSNETVAVLKSYRHLKGPLVFCTSEGRILKYTSPG